MANPIKAHIRQLALAKMLSIYGGLLVPKTFVCTKSLITMYNSGLSNKNMFMCKIYQKVFCLVNCIIILIQILWVKAKCHEIIELTDFIKNISKILQMN